MTAPRCSCGDHDHLEVLSEVSVWAFVQADALCRICIAVAGAMTACILVAMAAPS
jgi:hypothetical protein